VHPGDSPGTLTITGNYTQQSSGTLAIEVTGASAGSYSKLAVSGTASIAGTLAVTTSSPVTGSFQVLTAASLTGTFAPVTFTGQTDTVSYDATSVTLTATAPPAAPGNSSAPAISGSAAVGSTLSTSDGSWSGSPTSFAYQWRDCDATGGACTDIPGATANTYVVTASDVGHTIRVVVTATNGGGSTPATSDATATVPSPGGGSPPPDTTAPVIRSAGASPSTFAVDPKGRAETAVAAKAKAKAHLGTTLKYTLSEPARVVFTIDARTTGRTSGKRCVAATKKNRKKKHCTRYTRAGRFALASTAGANGHHFTGRIGGRKLGPGNYRVTLVATDAAGNHSAARQLTFRVVSR
jgi:hypothetical protein